MYKIVINALDESSFVKKKNELEELFIITDSRSNSELDSIIWCNSSSQTRVSVINNNIKTWLLFLDYDCYISLEVLDHMVQLMKETRENHDIVYAGSYINPIGVNYMQKAHNFIANTWFEQSYSVLEFNKLSYKPNYKLILGGVFLIHSTQKIADYENTLFWGAEDKALSYALNVLNYQISYVKEFKVHHNTSGSLFHFFKRACLHGKNEVRYIKKNKNNTNYLFWIRRIGFANLNLMPLILLHFCIQRTAGLVQKVHQGHK